MLLSLLAITLFAQLPSPAPFTWSPIGPLREARHSACAVRLTDGRYLIIGGQGNRGTLAIVEVVSAAGEFTVGSPLNSARYDHTCTVLDDGTVLVVAGRTAQGPVDTAELFDPNENTWTILDSKPQARFHHTATNLQTGRVLLAGGETSNGVSARLEIYEPLDQAFRTVIRPMSNARTGHTATPLRTGDVLLAGGFDGSKVLATTDLFDPLTETATAATPMPGPRRNHSANSLNDERVLIAGGNDGTVDLATAIHYDAGAGTYTPTGPLRTARSRHMAQLISGNGGVLIAGGIQGATYLRSSEVYEPETAAFAPSGDLLAARTDAVIAANEETGLIVLMGGQADGQSLDTCGITGVPTVTLDQKSYEPGTTVNVAGNRYPASLALTIRVTGFRADGSQPYENTFSRTTDASGQFTLSFTANEQGPGLVNTVTVQAASVTTIFQSFFIRNPSTCTITRTSAATGAEDPVGVAIAISAGVTPIAGLAPTSSLGLRMDGFPVLGGTRQGEFFLTPPVGEHTVSSYYVGDNSYSACTSESLPLTVRKRYTTPRVTFQQGAQALNPNALPLGEVISLTGIVDDEFAGTRTPGPPITGRLGIDRNNNTTFSTLTPAGAVPPTSRVNGTMTATPSGPFSLKLTYEGDANYNSSEAIVTGQVSRIATSTRLTVTGENFQLGEAIPVSASVTAPSLQGITPSGDVTFFDGVANLGSARLTAVTRSEYQAARTVVPTFAGLHNLSARFNQDPTFDSSASAPRTVQVAKAATNTTLILDPPLHAGSVIRVRVTPVPILPSSVIPPSGTCGVVVQSVSGEVVFSGSALCSQGAGGLLASVTLDSIPAGNYVIIATYPGDSNYLPSVSPEFEVSF